MVFVSGVKSILGGVRLSRETPLRESPHWQVLVSKKLSSSASPFLYTIETTLLGIILNGENDDIDTRRKAVNGDTPSVI
jgi:hypothetical protein